MIKILISGDFCPQNRVQNLIEKDDYHAVFGEVIEYTSKVDYSIVNLEAPVVDSSAKPIEKCGPNLKCTSKSIGLLKYAGFDMVTLANNHFYDYGEEGVKDTLVACKKEGIATVGGGMNLQEASRTINVNVKDSKVAIINCCEHEFSIATDKSGGSNPLNPIQQFYAIREAKEKADYIIVIVHGGHEMYQLPSPRMKETYRFFIDAGADVVINHHQHCYSGYEVYNGKPIFYGLGNFCFDWANKRNSIWNEGYMLILALNDSTLEFELVPYIQGDVYAGVKLLKENKENFFQNVFFFNSIIADDGKLAEEHFKFINKTSKWYLSVLEPYQNKYLKALYNRGLLPSFITKKQKNALLNYLKCESHLERLIHSVFNK